MPINIKKSCNLRNRPIPIYENWLCEHFVESAPGFCIRVFLVIFRGISGEIFRGCSVCINSESRHVIVTLIFRGISIFRGNLEFSIILILYDLTKSVPDPMIGQMT